jgi:hypothetical protein
MKFEMRTAGALQHNQKTPFIDARIVFLDHSALKTNGLNETDG